MTTSLERKNFARQTIKPPDGWLKKTCGWVCSAFEHKLACWVIGAFFISALLIWFLLDHRIPSFDPAWHALYSNSFRRFITHPREWSFLNLIALTKQNCLYPPAGWALNGIMKVVFTDSSWSDKLCLLVQSIVLTVSFYKYCMLSLGSRLRSNLSLLLLLSFPLILGLEHVPLLDLQNVAIFSCFMWALAHWEKNPNRKNMIICGLVLGLNCLVKQTAAFYCAPLLFILIGWKLIRKDHVQASHIIMLGSIGALLLFGFWILPNFSEIVSYTNWRSETIGTTEKLCKIYSNLRASSAQIFEGLGPLTLMMSLPLFMKANLIDTIRRSKLALIAGMCGWLVVITIAYYNTPEARYFPQVLLPVAMLIGSAIANALRTASAFRSILAITLILFAPLQMFLTCFRPAPAVLRPIPVGVDPIYAALGFKDIFYISFLPYQKEDDPWKQKWVFKTIDSVEKGRYVWLCIIPGTFEFNQGSMVYLGNQFRTHSYPISWRGCLPNMHDSFKYTAAEFNSVDWFLLKSGYQGTPIEGAESVRLYETAIKTIEHGGDYVLMSQESLPDGSILKLYRKNYAKIWLRDAAKRKIASAKKDDQK